MVGVVWAPPPNGRHVVSPMSHRDAVKHVRARVHGHVWGTVWPVSCESRWTHTMTLRKRWLTATIGNNTLQKGLATVQTSWQIDESMVSTLERIIRADSGDFSARNKLKLLRVVRQMCKPGVACVSAIYVLHWHALSSFIKISSLVVL